MVMWWHSTNCRWWATPASSSSPRGPLQGTWGRREPAGTSQFLLSRCSLMVNVKEWDVILLRKTWWASWRSFSWKRRRQAEDGPTSYQQSETWTCDWLAIYFTLTKIIEMRYLNTFQDGGGKPSGIVGWWGGSSNCHGWRGAEHQRNCLFRLIENLERMWSLSETYK